MELLAFPVNLILTVLWVAAVLFLWRNHGSRPVMRFLLSPWTTITSILLFASGCLVLGFTCDVSLTGSWWFVAELVFLMTVLLAVLLRGLRDASGKLRVRFILNHAGLLLVLVSLFCGIPDNDILRVSLVPGQETGIAYREDGSVDRLSHTLLLDDFTTDYFDNGVPSVYEAKVQVDGRPVSIKVNDPFTAGFGEQVYLVAAGGEGEGGCVLQVVRQPWKYLTVIGILMMIAGAVMLFAKGPDRR
ncbi:MAG: cytochrome c biogenesis protein ResB [Candidatus Cryptobacteroides sp.]